MKKNSILLLVFSALLFSSCGVLQEKKEFAQDDYELLDEALNETKVSISRDIDTTPLDIPDEDPYTELTKSVYDFGPYITEHKDFEFRVIDKNMEGEAPYSYVSDIYVNESDLSFYDNYGNEYEFKSFVGGTGSALVSISPSSFNRKKVYYVELKNDALMFQGKDEDIRRLTFYTLDRGFASGLRTVDYKDDIVDLDSTKVYYFDEDGYSPYFIYDEEIAITKGATFRLRNPSLESDDIETIYGKFIGIQKNPNGAGYMVRYNPAKGEDIYTSLNINDSKRLDESDTVTYYNQDEEMEQQISQAVIHNPSMVTTVYGIMNNFNVKANNYRRSVIDWGSRIDIKFNTSYDPNTDSFTFSASAAYSFYPTEHISITLKLGYKQTWSFDVSASVSIETEFLIPVGINYTLKVVEDTQKEVYFGVYISYDWSGEYNEEACEESLNKALADAFASRSDWQKKSVFNGDSGASTPGGATYPLFKISCTAFLPIEIYFDVEFYWELVPTVEAIIRYSSHTQRVDLCCSNSGGADPSSDSATKTNSDLSFSLMGKVHFEAGFRISIGVDILGLYKFFHVEVYLKLYGAIDIEGFMFMDISWNDTEPVSANFQLGAKLEVSVGLKVGIDIYLLFGGYNHEWPIVGVVLFGVQSSNPFQEFVENTEDIYINEHDYNSNNKTFNLSLSERHLLTARCFNSKTFSVDIKDLNYNDKIKTMYGAFVPHDIEERVFEEGTFETKEGELQSPLSLTDDGHISMDTIEGQDNFVVELTIKVNSAVTFGAEPVKVIVIHFENNDRQEVKIDGQSYGSFVNGTNLKLPIQNPRRYLTFTGYSYEDKDGKIKKISYSEFDPEQGPIYYNVDTSGEFRSVNLISCWEDYFHWEVYFVDGFNNIIEKQMVLDGEDATAPDENKRDYHMIANPPDDTHHYVFVGYDCEFTNIKRPTVVRAIYKIVNN